jgi:hypothetical protein
MMPRTRVRGCGGKVRFRDHEEAVEALHRANFARRRCVEDGATTTHGAVRTYYCPRCSGYHLASRPAS